MFTKLANLPRLSKQIIMIFTDSILLILILWASYSIRLVLWYLPKDDTFRLILAAPIIAIPIFSSYSKTLPHFDSKPSKKSFIGSSGNLTILIMSSPNQVIFDVSWQLRFHISQWENSQWLLSDEFVDLLDVLDIWRLVIVL